MLRRKARVARQGNRNGTAGNVSVFGSKERSGPREFCNCCESGGRLAALSGGRVRLFGGHWRRDWRVVGGAWLAEFLKAFRGDQKLLADASVASLRFCHAAIPHQALQFVVGSQSQHFLSASADFSFLEGGVNIGEEGFELEAFRAEQRRDQFFHEKIRDSA